MVRKIIGVLPPMHPGEVLREEFLKPMNMAAGRLAKAAGCRVRASSALRAGSLASQATPQFGLQRSSVLRRNFG